MSRFRSQQMIVHICRTQDPMNFPLTNYGTRVSPTITSRRFITRSFGRSTYFSHLFQPSNVRSVNVIESQRRQVRTRSISNKINFRKGWTITFDKVEKYRESVKDFKKSTFKVSFRISAHSKKNFLSKQTVNDCLRIVFSFQGINLR